MNIPKKLAISLIAFGVGLYFLTLETIRLINYFAPELGLTTPVFFGGACLICAVLIVTGITLLFRPRNGFKLFVLVVCSLLAAMATVLLLVYLAYFIPSATGPIYTLWDWCVMVCNFVFAALCICASIFLFWKAIKTC